MTPFRRLASAPRRATLRPVKAADATAMQAFVTGLDAEARRLRFHGAVNACAPGLLRHLTEADGVRHVAFVACVQADDGGERIVGEARYVVSDGTERSAEFGIAVADDQRGSGIADDLLIALIDAAADAGISSLHGDVLPGNRRMAGFMQRHGFGIDPFASVEPGHARWAREVAVRKTVRPSLAALGAWLGRAAARRLAL